MDVSQAPNFSVNRFREARTRWDLNSAPADHTKCVEIIKTQEVIVEKFDVS